MNFNKMRVVVALSLSVVLMLVASLVLAGSYTSSPGTTLNGPGSISDTIAVAEAGSINGITVGVNISDPAFISDLYLDVTSPSGTTVRLFNHQCGGAANIIATFDDNAADPDICNGNASGGSFQPFESLSAFIGEPAQGNWTLTLGDTLFFETNTLNSWTLSIQASATGSTGVTFYSDGRLNNYDIAAPVAVYPYEGGIDIYSINPATGEGVFTARISAEELAQVVDANTALFMGENAYTGDPVVVYLLTTGEFQVMSVDISGNDYVFIG